MNFELTPERCAQEVHTAHIERWRWQRALAAGHTEAPGPVFVRTRELPYQRVFDALDPAWPEGPALRGHLAQLIWSRLAAPYDVRLARLHQAPNERHATPFAPSGSVLELQRVLWGLTNVDGEAAAPKGALDEHLEHLASAGAAWRSAWHERGEARREVTRRLGLARLEDAALPFTTASLLAHARTFLADTQPLARTIVAEWERERGPCSRTDVLLALRGHTVAGMPQRLSLTWLHQTLPQFANASVDPRGDAALPRLLLQPLPDVTGAASFARALARLGQAVVVGARVTPSEWVRSVDGAWFAPTRMGLLFASLTTEASFLSRSFDLASSERDRAQRAFAQAGLFAARTDAARLLLEESDGSTEELAATTFVRSLPTTAFGLLPRAREDAAVRFAAWLEHPALAERARDLFDEDWFRNPRSQSWVMLPEAAHELAGPAPLRTLFERLCA